MVTEPGRHAFLLDRARNLRGIGLSGPRLREELQRLNRDRCSPPKAEIEVNDIADWIDQPAFYTGLQVTLRRRFGADEAARRLTVLFRFLLSRPISDACSGAGPRRTVFFSQED